MSRFFAEILVENDRLTLTGWLVTMVWLLSAVSFVIEIAKWVA